MGSLSGKTTRENSLARLHIIRSSCHLPPEEIIAELYTRVLDFAGGTPQQDDLTAVVIKKTIVRQGELEARASA